MRSSLLEELADRDEREEVRRVGDITFENAYGRVFIRCAADGRIWVDSDGKGEKLVERDPEVVDALRRFMRDQGYLRARGVAGKRGRNAAKDEIARRARGATKAPAIPDTGIRVETAADRKPHDCACACGGIDAHLENVKANACACPGCTSIFQTGGIS